MENLLLNWGFWDKKILKNKTVLDFSLQNLKSWKVIKLSELLNFLWKEIFIILDSVIIFEGFEIDFKKSDDMMFFDEKNNIVWLYFKEFSDSDLQNIFENNFETYEKNILNNSEKIIDENNYRDLISKIWLKNTKNAYIYCPHQTLPAQFFYNFFAFWIARIILPTKITPNQISTLSFVLTIIWIFLMIFFYENFWILVIWALIIHIWFIFDCVDGWLARIKKMWSNFGWFLDASFDTIKITLLFLTTIYIEFLRWNVEIVYLWVFLLALKYLNTSIYNTAVYFTKNDTAASFSNSSWKIKKLLQKLNIQPNQITLSNDFLIIFLTFWIVFNFNSAIFILLIFYYFIQFSVFYFINLKNLKNEIKNNK